MRAAVRSRYGAPDVVELREVERPQVADDEILIRVRACSVNPYDYHVALAGRPYIARVGAGLRRPKDPGLGVDVAGTVEAVGQAFGGLEVGDAVYGFGTAAFAEYARAGAAVARKPANLSFEEAAAAPTAASTALQALHDKGEVQPGQRVLVNGASGGVGTYAVQIAKAAGAAVTGVCSTAHTSLVRSLGADHVVDYRWEDFTRATERYDLLVDVAGTRPWSELRRALAPDGICVLVGGPKDDRVLGPLSRWGTTSLAAVGDSRRVAVLLTQMRRADLDTIRGLFEAGSVRSVVERTYRLEATADALRHVGAGHARGKTVVTVARTGLRPYVT